MINSLGGWQDAENRPVDHYIFKSLNQWSFQENKLDVRPM